MDGFLVRQDGYSKNMGHPIFKILQRIFANTIYGREECSKMLNPELQCLYCITHNIKFDLGYEFVRKLQRLASSTSGKIVIGGLITRIARCLDIDFTGYDAIPPTYIDITHLKNAKIIDTKGPDGFYLTKNPVTERITQINTERIPVSNRKNWYASWCNKTRLQRRDDDSESEEEEEDDSESEEEEEDESAEEEENEDMDDTDTPAPPPSQPSSSFTPD